MPHDPIQVADTRAWLAKADMDLRAAAHELTAVPPFRMATAARDPGPRAYVSRGRTNPIELRSPRSPLAKDTLNA